MHPTIRKESMRDKRVGAKQPERFDHHKAAQLDDPARFDYLPPGEVFALLDAPKSVVVVDFGAGTGTYALKLAQARPDLAIIALDEQPRMLEFIRKKLSASPVPNLRPVLADEKGLAGLRECAARVLALNVLHEMGDDAIRRLAALLAPHGQVLFIDWNAIERPVGPPREHVFTPAEAIHRLGTFGLRVIGEKPFRYHYALICKRSALRASSADAESPAPGSAA